MSIQLTSTRCRRVDYVMCKTTKCLNRIARRLNGSKTWHKFDFSIYLTGVSSCTFTQIFNHSDVDYLYSTYKNYTYRTHLETFSHSAMIVMSTRHEGKYTSERAFAPQWYRVSPYQPDLGRRDHQKAHHRVKCALQ